MCFIYEQDVQDDTHGARNLKGQKTWSKVLSKISSDRIQNISLQWTIHHLKGTSGEIKTQNFKEVPW